jgi:hypothetical protein
LQRLRRREAGFGLLVSCSGCWSAGRLGSIRPGSFSAMIAEAFTWIAGSGLFAGSQVLLLLR